MAIRQKRWKKQEEPFPDYNFLKKIVNELGLNTKQMHPYKLLSIIKQMNTEIADWCVKNPEGFRMPYDMGYMAVTKIFLIPFHDGRWEVIDRIKNLSGDKISDRFREKLIRKYNKKIDIPTTNAFLERGKFVNYLMYFNRKNCSISKGRVYMFRPVGSVRDRVKNLDSSNYYLFKYCDFYDYKIKPFDK